MALLDHFAELEPPRTRIRGHGPMERLLTATYAVRGGAHETELGVAEQMVWF